MPQPEEQIPVYLWLRIPFAGIKIYLFWGIDYTRNCRNADPESSATSKIVELFPIAHFAFSDAL